MRAGPVLKSVRRKHGQRGVTLPVLQPYSCYGAVLLEPPLDDSVDLLLASLNSENSTGIDPPWERWHSEINI